jgi:ribonuclease-3
MARQADATDPTIAALETLQTRLEHHFARPHLLELALSHRSWCAEHEGYESNERLEFLGDAVLGMVVTDHIFTGYPTLSEGELAKIRAAVVSAAALCDVAKELDIGPALRLGRGEETSGGRSKASILADAMEAVLGAVYVDGGWDPAQTVVMRLFGSRMIEAASEPGLRDYKTRLQELVARRGGPPPDYLVLEAGPDHAKSFEATVSVAGEVRGVGGGRSKKQAQQAAARQAWLTIIDFLPVEDEPSAVGYSAIVSPLAAADSMPLSAADSMPLGASDSITSDNITSDNAEPERAQVEGTEVNGRRRYSAGPEGAP